MLNDVIFEGIIVKSWKYADDLLFRLACYRDPDVPQKAPGDVHDAADYVSVRVPKGNLGAPVVLENGQQIRVHGFLQSRDYEESLADFLKDAKGSLPLPEGLDPDGLKAQRGTTEIVARRILLSANGSGKKR
ncbi:MAG: hypothetical protein ACOYYS_18765 [Chloroflexota bacterium]